MEQWFLNNNEFHEVFPHNYFFVNAAEISFDILRSNSGKLFHRKRCCIFFVGKTFIF